MSVLPEGTQGQLQPEAARVPRPQHEVRPVSQEGEGGQGRADPLRQGRAGHVHAQLGTSQERGVTHPPPHPTLTVERAYRCPKKQDFLDKFTSHK